MEGMYGHAGADVRKLTGDPKEGVIISLEVFQNVAVEDTAARHCR
jgi:hypothetical protein